MISILHKSPSHTLLCGMKTLLIIMREEYESIEYGKNESTTS